VEKMETFLREKKMPAEFACASFQNLVGIKVELEEIVPFRGFECITISKTSSYYLRTPSSGCEEKKFELDDYNASLQMPTFTQKSGSARSETSSKSRNSSVQKQFTDSLVQRDFDGSKPNATCLLCGAGRESEVKLNGCHVVPFSSTIEVMRAVGLMTLNDVRNGILCCVTCHTHQGDGLWDIGEHNLPIISGALMSEEKYARIANEKKPLNVPVGPDAPSPLVWKFHSQHCTNMKENRDLKKTDHQCTKCGSYLATAKTLLKHLGTCNGNFKTKYFTPEKGANGDGGDEESELGEEDDDAV